jgi:hypothetical protein
MHMCSSKVLWYFWFRLKDYGVLLYADLSDVELTAAARGLAMSLAFTPGNDGLPLLATPTPFEQLHHVLESRPYRGGAAVPSGPISVAAARTGPPGNNAASLWALGNLRAPAHVSDSALNSLLAAVISGSGVPTATAGRGAPLPRSYYVGLPMPFGVGGDFGSGPAARYQVDVTLDALNNFGGPPPISQPVPARTPGLRSTGLSAFGMMQARSAAPPPHVRPWPAQFVLHVEREDGLDEVAYLSGMSSNELRMYGPGDTSGGGIASQASAVQLVLDAERETVMGASNWAPDALPAPVNTLTVPPPFRQVPTSRGAAVAAAAAASSADLTGSQLRSFFRAASFADAAQLTVRGTSAGGSVPSDGRSEWITNQLLLDAMQRTSAASASAARSGLGAADRGQLIWEYPGRRPFDMAYSMLPGPPGGMPTGQGRGDVGGPAADEPSMLLARLVRDTLTSAIVRTSCRILGFLHIDQVVHQFGVARI